MTKAKTRTQTSLPLFEGKANRAELFRQAIEEEVALLKSKKEPTDKIDHKKIVLIVQTNMSKYPPSQRVKVELLESYRYWSYYRQKKGHPPQPVGRPKKSESPTIKRLKVAPPDARTGPVLLAERDVMEQVPGEALNGESRESTTPTPQAHADDTQTQSPRNANEPHDTSSEPLGSVVFPPESPLVSGDGRMVGPSIPSAEGYHAFSSRELKAVLVLLRIFNWDMERTRTALDLVSDFREEVGRG